MATTASLAPGARAAVWAAGIGVSAGPPRPAARSPAPRRGTHRSPPSRVRNGCPSRGVAIGHHVMRMKRDDGVEPVIVARGGVDGLGAAHLFGGLAHEADGAGDAVPFHGGLGRKRADQRTHAQCRMGIGVAAGKARQALARRAVGVGHLAVAGHRVILGIGHDGGPGRCDQVAQRRSACRRSLASTVKPSARRRFPHTRRSSGIRARRFRRDPRCGVPRRPFLVIFIDPVEG